MIDVMTEVLSVKPTIKILIVDDREDNLFSIETILEKDNYLIRKANSGRAALRILLKEDDFTIILMDVQMPDLNGFETATIIYERDKLKHIPIIFITANSHGDESMFTGYKMGGVDYIYKPISPELLRAKISVFVDLFKKNHQLIAQEHKMATANKMLEIEIKERINSEQQVTLLNKQLLDNISNLKVSNEALERFAYVASHDLQEPLRKINLFSDQLIRKYEEILNDDGKQLLGKIIKASDRMRVLIKDILSFSRSASNSEAFEITNLNELIAGIISDLEVSIQQKKAIIKIEGLKPLKIIPGQFRQLFQNLLINSLKFSKENQPPEIHIYAEESKIRQAKEAKGTLTDNINDHYYCIYIKDNGIGFEQKYADQIFTLFKRLNSSDKFEGTGIGLSICKKVMDQHNGHISVESKPGEGTTFMVSLPMNRNR